MFFLFPTQSIFEVPRRDSLAACTSKILFCLKKKNEILTQALVLPFKTAIFSCPLSISLSLSHLISGLVFLTQCVLGVEFLAKSMLHF